MKFCFKLIQISCVWIIVGDECGVCGCHRALFNSFHLNSLWFPTLKVVHRAGSIFFPLNSDEIMHWEFTPQGESVESEGGHCGAFHIPLSTGAFFLSNQYAHWSDLLPRDFIHFYKLKIIFERILFSDTEGNPAQIENLKKERAAALKAVCR